MIEPESFSVQGVTGLGMRGVPKAEQIALMIKILPDGRACLLEPAIPPKCVLTFERQAARWKLVAVAASNMEIQRARVQ